MKPTTMLLLALSGLAIGQARAECLLERESCKYICIETNQHGQCVKTRKECEMVCVQFDVDVSGQDTTNYPPPKTDSEAH